ncbi:hypothetical protein Sfum_3426 [Syntrophobacter fumaroxidans MPOB]|uniref:Uncharacterized protein n=1 Tax=Syntrophobacter fumaroxidans (strain DSM 10017 / MPOB) TaxID=335543 RepID=A0LNU6_SYNFM|nr:hypothetical protein Sfum_3426 [Syntrophobacter fumaroxidans MPOB]
MWPRHENPACPRRHAEHVIETARNTSRTRKEVRGDKRLNQPTGLWAISLETTLDTLCPHFREATNPMRRNGFFPGGPACGGPDLSTAAFGRCRGKD